MRQATERINVRQRNAMPESPLQSENGGQANSHFVVDGFERAWEAIEAEVRPEVEEKYAQEWNSSGIIKRWCMLREIEREIADRVSERLKHVSDDAMF